MAAKNDRHPAAAVERGGSLDTATAVNPQSAPRIRDENFREYYSNVSQVRLTPFDLTILFGRYGEESGRQVHIESASVTMSPLQFKVFASSLGQMVEAFERSFGPIGMPKLGMQPSISADGIADLIDSAIQQAAGQPAQQASKTKKTTPQAK